MDLSDLPLLLGAFLPLLISFIFLMLVATGWMVAQKYGGPIAYVAFVWVIPLVSTIWLKWEDRLGFESPMGSLFLLYVIFVSFVVGVVCLPLVLYLNWRQLSRLKVIGLVLCAQLHSFPFYLFAYIWGSVFILPK